nr:putative ribonuclease h protein [Quercus suber]
MEVEWTGGVMNAETVTSNESPFNSGAESVTEESLKHANSNPVFSQSGKHNLGCIDSDSLVTPNVIEGGKNVTNSARSVEGNIMLNELNMGNNLRDTNLNPKSFESATTSRAPKLMQKTLVDSNNANHTFNPTINETVIQAVDGDVSQLANLRMWKRIMRQSKPSGAKAEVEQGTKRKLSTELSDFLPFITSPLVRGFEDVTVESLINPDAVSWNIPLLNDLFLPRDIALIKSIPLSNIAAEDKLFWPFTPSGIYSVKSGYRFLCKVQSLDDHSYQSDTDSIWKKVWGLAVQPKIRNFLWCAIKDTIPTKANLKRRRVIPSDCCDHCHNTSENTLHALWSCPSLSQVWSLDQCWRNCYTRTFQSFRDLIEHIIDEGLDVDYFATIVWMVWHRRNTLRTTNKAFPIQQVLPEKSSSDITAPIKSLPRSHYELNAVTPS